MSGITNGAAGAGVAAPPPPAFHVGLSWTGSVFTDVTSASGSTSGSNRFVHSVGGGVPPYTDSISQSGSSKLGLFNLAGQLGVTWSGLNVGDSEVITVSYTASDSNGSGGNSSDSAIIRRVS